MSKKKILLILVLLPALALAVITAYGYFFPEAFYHVFYRNLQDLLGERAQELVVGQSYMTDDRVFQLVDDQHFFYFMDFADYETQEELEDYRGEMEDESIVPYLILVEGEYSRKGEAVFIKETRGVLVSFDQVQDVKDRLYASLEEIDYVETGYGTEPQLVKTDQGYHYHQDLYLPSSNTSFEKIGQLDSLPVYESEEPLAASIDHFLSAYKAKNNE